MIGGMLLELCRARPSNGEIRPCRCETDEVDDERLGDTVDIGDNNGDRDGDRPLVVLLCANKWELASL